MTNQNSDLDQLSAAALRPQLIAAQEENQKLNMLIATMISELTAPLNVIQAYAYLLLDEEKGFYNPMDSEQAKAVVDIMRKGAVRSNELLQEAKKILTKADTLENLESSLVQDYRRELQVANQQVDKLNLKHDAIRQTMSCAANDFLTQVSFVLGYSQLMLEHPESMGGVLNSEQLEGIEAIDRYAKNIHEGIKYYIFDGLRAIDLVDEEPEPEEVTLAEIGEMTQFSIESDLALDTAVSVNKREAEAIINLLAMAWYRRNKGSVLEVTAELGEYLRFRFPHTTEIPSSYAKDSVDGETGRLQFTERQRYFDPVGLATGLVEKYGGAVYAELTSEKTYNLSFTLPVYREES